MSTSQSSGSPPVVRLPGRFETQRTFFPSATLALISILFGLTICEAGLRLFASHGPNIAEFRGNEVAGKPVDARDAFRYVERLAAEPGTDRQWFTEDPPPLPNRSKVVGWRLERYRDFEKRGIYAAQADYIWNRYYVESQRCAPNSTLLNYPASVFAFDPPRESTHPRYRFPPNVTTAAGLVTNDFGMRGQPVTLAKPPRTIRIAFLGASTTVGYHQFRFSYPEYVNYWLNRYAQSRNYAVRFEALNAGREGINSEDIAAIVQDELLALDPDLAVYYEGSNQFGTGHALVSPQIPPRSDIDPNDPIVEHKIPQLIRTHLAVGDLLDRALNGFRSAGEPRKPAYRLMWPAGVDELKPNVDDSRLPLLLPVIVKDLDSIRRSLDSIGGQLAVCSFEWLAKDGMPLSAKRHPFIYKQLNAAYWPLRYADIRRLADFQNRVLSRYASARKVPFLDVASALPQDPSLFDDAIHMNEAGDRIKAWIIFQQLVPIVRRKIESGEWPRTGAHNVPPLPSLAASEMSARCNSVPTGPLERINGALSLATIESAYNGSSLEHGRPVKVITGGQQWGYAASIPVDRYAGLTRPCYLYLRARVVNGEIGLAVLDRESGASQLEKAVAPSPDMADIYVPVMFPDRLGGLLIRNIAPNGVHSEILIDDTALLAFLKPLPDELVKAIPLERVHLESHGVAREQGPDGLVLTTEPGQGAYAARIALDLGAGPGQRLRLHVWLRVLEGTISVGILNQDRNAFLMERSVWPGTRPTELILPLPSPPVTGDLIVRNAAQGNIISKGILEKIEIRKSP
jgi:lysophospholipase L1-like esterase